jgi:hypothetical protein
VVVECLAPCDECETGESLRLEFESEVEVLEIVSQKQGGLQECENNVPALSRIRQMVHRLRFAVS